MKKLTKSQKGSALLVVLIIVASAITTTLIVMQSSTSLTQTYARKSNSQVADNLTQLVSSLLADQSVCTDGFDGPGGEAGLQFVTPFSLSAAQGVNKLDVSLPSNFPGPTGGTRLRLQNNLSIPDSNLKINRIYVTDAKLLVGTTFTMDLMAEFAIAQAGTNVIGLSPRKIMSLKVVFSGATVSSCGQGPSVNSNQSLCEGMNCTYTPASSGSGTCYCRVKPMSCPTGDYVASVVNYTPQCSGSTITRTCPNGYLVALDTNSNAVCADVVSCPTGTSANGLGGTASPAACKCTIAGQVWDSATSTCGGAVTCSGGATTTVTSVPASPAGCYCPSGQTWNGTSCTGTAAACWNLTSSTVDLTTINSAGYPSANWSCPSYTIKSPPKTPTGSCTLADTCTVDWKYGTDNWTCGTGTCSVAASCLSGASTSGAGGPASPQGCYCINSGETWNGSTCVGAVGGCTGGASTTATSSTAPPLGCFCPYGQAWNYTTSICEAPLCWEQMWKLPGTPLGSESSYFFSTRAAVSAWCATSGLCYGSPFPTWTPSDCTTLFR